jgi:hypothetical protein
MSKAKTDLSRIRLVRATFMGYSQESYSVQEYAGACPYCNEITTFSRGALTKCEHYVGKVWFDGVDAFVFEEVGA